jgi:hypothetical protein
MKEDKTSGACSTYGRDRNENRISVGKSETDHLRDLGVDWRRILK